MTLPIGLNGLGAQPLAVMELEVEPELVLVLTNVLELPQKLRLVLVKLHATVSIFSTIFKTCFEKCVTLTSLSVHSCIVQCIKQYMLFLFTG